MGPSADKGKHAWQRIFPAPFTLFALVGTGHSFYFHTAGGWFAAAATKKSVRPI